MPEKGNDSLLASHMGWVKSNRNSRTLREKKLKKKKEVQARGILYRGGIMEEELLPSALPARR